MRFFKRPTRRELLDQREVFENALHNAKETLDSFRIRLSEMSQRLITSRADLQCALDRARGLARDRDAMKEERDKARCQRDTVAKRLGDTERRLKAMTKDCDKSQVQCRDLIRERDQVIRQRDAETEKVLKLSQCWQRDDRKTRDRLQVVINSLFRTDVAEDNDE